MKLKDLAVNHDFYASDHNYYSNDAGDTFDNWSDFYEEFYDADIDLNLVIRWDIFKNENVQFDSYYMQVIIIAQRNGIYMPFIIRRIEENDVPQIIEFMEPHFKKILSIWNPLSNFYK